MSNNYFRFKKFLVQQEHCAMKVCTDACLFGAYLAGKNTDFHGRPFRILDIGTGTGLLSLMLAQKFNDAIIDSVEIDESAAMQAAENFRASPWKERLSVHHRSIQRFNQSTIQLYNLIVCNPPFFENDLKSNDDKRNIALHNDALSLDELLCVIERMLTADGSFAVLLPWHRTVYFETIAAEKKLYVKEKMLVRQTPKHSYFRSMLLFCRQQTTTVEKEITISNEGNVYTNEFAALLKDYYLHL